MRAGVAGVVTLHAAIICGDRSAGRGQVEQAGRLGQSKGGEDGRPTGMSIERWATVPEPVSSVTKCMRSSPGCDPRQVQSCNGPSWLARTQQLTAPEAACETRAAQR